MYDKWSLDVFYKGVDDPNIEKDFSKLEALIGEYRAALASAGKKDEKASLHEIMDIKEQMSDVTNRLYVYFRLRRSANNTDKEGAPYRSRIQELMTSTAKDDVVFKRFVGGISDLDCVIKGDCLLEEYGFYLKEIKDPQAASLNEAICHYIQRHYSIDLTTDLICKKFSCSKSYFSHSFKSYTGKSFREYLTDIRLNYAKQLLEYSNLNVTQISYSVGFNDSNYFSNVFKQKIGLSPLLYRKIKKQ